MEKEKINLDDFLEFLRGRSEFFVNSKGVINYSEYYDYNDSLSMRAMEEIISDKESDDSIENAVQWYLNDNEYTTYDDVISEACYDYAEERGLDYEEVIDELREIFYNHVEYDPNIDRLLSNTKPDDFHILFGENWDDEYFEMEKWNEFLSDIEDNEVNEEEVNEKLSKTYLGWLLDTQGYKPYDVFRNHEDKSENKFLDQVYSELFDYVTSLNGMQLTAVINTSNWDAVVCVDEHKPFIIKKGTSFGLFNKVHGSGSGFEIEIEKDIVVKDIPYKYSLDGGSGGSYSPMTVYGQSIAIGDENLECVKEEEQREV